MPQTTEHLLQGLPDWLTSDRAQHPVADLLSARAQAWQPCRPTAMKRKAGGVLHLWRVLLAAAAAPGTCAGAKTACPAQGIFRAGNRQAAAKKQRPVNRGLGRSCPKAFPRVWCSGRHLWGTGSGTHCKGEGRNLCPWMRYLTRAHQLTSECLRPLVHTELVLQKAY